MMHRTAGSRVRARVDAGPPMGERGRLRAQGSVPGASPGCNGEERRAVNLRFVLYYFNNFLISLVFLCLALTAPN